MPSSSYIRRRMREASERGRRMGLASARARERRALESDEPMRGERTVRPVSASGLGAMVGRMIGG